MAGRGVGSKVEVNEGVSHRVSEGVADWVAALVPDRAFVQGD